MRKNPHPDLTQWKGLGSLVKQDVMFYFMSPVTSRSPKYKDGTMVKDALYMENFIRAEYVQSITRLQELSRLKAETQKEREVGSVEVSIKPPPPSSLTDLDKGLGYRTHQSSGISCEILPTRLYCTYLYLRLPTFSNPPHVSCPEMTTANSFKF